MRARSPYEIQFSEANLDKVTLQIYIYTGTKDTDKGSVLYTVEGFALTNDPTSGNPEVVFDLAPFVRDYLRSNISFNNDYQTFTYWLSYVSTRVVNGVEQTPDAIQHLNCDFGYHDHEDGAQYLGGSDGAEANVKRFTRSVVSKPYGVGLVLPVPYDIDEVNYLIGSEVQYTYTPTGLSADESADRIQYVSFGDVFDESYKNNALRNGARFCAKNDFKQTRLCNAVKDCIDVDEIVLTYLDFSTQASDASYVERDVVKVESYDENYDNYKLTFINKHGAFEDLWFVGDHVSKLKVDSTEIKRNTRANATYDINKHQYRSLFKNGRRSLVLNSGWVNESQYKAFEELLLSEFVWMSIDGRTQPINIKTSDLNEQTSRREKTINYTLEIQFSNDVINNFQ